MKRSKKVMALAARYARARAKRAKSTRRDPSGDDWEVIVGNIGTVYSGRNRAEARTTFTEYAKQSKSAHSRASGEDVTLMRNGEPESEHIGSPRDVRNKRKGNRAARIIQSLSNKRDLQRRLLASVRESLAAVGITFRSQDGEHRVNFRGGGEGTAYYTDDLSDALVTGQAMARNRVKPAGDPTRDPAEKRGPTRKHPKIKEYPSKHGKRDAGTLWVIWGPVSQSWVIFQGPDPFSPGGARQIGSERTWAEADRFAKGYFS